MLTRDHDINAWKAALNHAALAAADLDPCSAGGQIERGEARHDPASLIGRPHPVWADFCAQRSSCNGKNAQIAVIAKWCGERLKKATLSRGFDTSGISIEGIESLANFGSEFFE